MRRPWWTICACMLLAATPLGAQEGLDAAYGLLAEGRTSEGRLALMEATGVLAPSAAVPHLKAARLLGRLSASMQPRAARAMAAQYHGAPDALTTFKTLIAEAGPDDVPQLLAYAALLADREDPAEAERLRVALIEGYPDAIEWSDAVVEVAGSRLRSGEGVAEAIGWLEALLVQQPQGALAPGARRILEQLKGTGR